MMPRMQTAIDGHLLAVIGFDALKQFETFRTFGGNASSLECTTDGGNSCIKPASPHFLSSNSRGTSL